MNLTTSISERTPKLRIFSESSMVWLLRPSDKHEEISFEPVQARVRKAGTIAESEV